jgi:hypothetical protein
MDAGPRCGRRKWVGGKKQASVDPVRPRAPRGEASPSYLASGSSLSLSKSSSRGGNFGEMSMAEGYVGGRQEEINNEC